MSTFGTYQKEPASGNSISQSNRVKALKKLSILANDPATFGMVSLIISGNPPAWLLQTVLHDSLITSEGKPVFGKWLSDIYSKTFRYLLFLLAIKYSDGSVPGFSIQSLQNIHEVFVDDSTVMDFIEEIFPLLGKRTRISGKLGYQSFSPICSINREFHKQFTGQLVLSKAELGTPSVIKHLIGFQGKILNKDITLLDRTKIDQLKHFSCHMTLEGVIEVEDTAINELCTLQKCKLGIQNHHVWGKSSSQSSKQLLVLMRGSDTFIDVPHSVQMDLQIALKLSKTRKSIHMHGQFPLTREIARSLAGHKGKISFDATFFEPEVEIELSNHLGCVWANKLQKIHTIELALKLAESAYQSKLELDLLPDFSAEIGKGLATVVGDLSLNSIKALDDENAKTLSFHIGDLCLNRLEEISEEGAKHLLKKNGKCHLYTLKSLFSSRPFEREFLYRWVLAFQHEVLDLKQIFHLDEGICNALLFSRGALRLPSLKSMDQNAASHLASNYRGHSLFLRLDGKPVKEIEVAIATNSNINPLPF